MNQMTLGQAGIDFFESRRISAETAARFEIHTAMSRQNEIVPDAKGRIIAFPFFERGKVVAAKYRTLDKKFWQRPGGKRTFWNADALDDPALLSGHMPLIITEGEIDALSAIDCGFPLTVSVPDGAPTPPNAEAETKATSDDAKGKFEFIWNNRERLSHIKRFVLAVDSDEPGQYLASELVRRLSAARCFFVTYPEGCKDLNDVLVGHGPEAVTAVLNGAKPYPVRGLYRLSDYPEAGQLKTLNVGWQTFDEVLRLFRGEFMVVTGIPSHGKSTWVLNLLVNMAELHGWRSALFSPEMPVVPQLRDKLRRIRSRHSSAQSPRVDAWIHDHFVFIDADPTGDQDEDFDLDWIISRAVDAVLRDAIDVLVIDPWNEIEHARFKNETTTEYIGRSIRALKRFARLYDVAVIVVAHPTKDIVGKDGKHRVPSLYDVEGSAHWFNKCDHGIVVERPDPASSAGTIWVAKSRFDEAGEKGSIRMQFNRLTSRFEMCVERMD